MMSHVQSARNSKTYQRDGFTIIEVMIALTASLLMMLALTRAFKMIGDKISISQSELEMGSTLRNITFAMRDELDRMTAPSVAPLPRDSSTGYFTYYEGPWADGTTQLINNVGPQAGYLPTSRYGDLDDYVAFTARAKTDAPFVGLIPRGVLESHRFESHLLAGNVWNTFVTSDGISINNYTLNDAYHLVPFYSDLAEVAYFCAPDWSRDNLGQPIYDAAGHPLFVDVVNEVGGAGLFDRIPDRLTLRRRILLIRPDLNMTPRRMYQVTGAVLPAAAIGTDENIGQLPVLTPPAGGSPPQIRPIATQDTRFQVGPWSPNLQWPTGVLDAERPTWLTGLARVQQLMDLSVSRMTNSWEVPGTPGSIYGMPANNSLATGTPGIVANSLESLSRPENRFAHVRLPITIGGEAASAMPMLALCPPHPFLSAQEQITRATAVTTDDRFGQAVTGTPVNYGRFTMVGFLRPEFTLTDYTVVDRTSPATAAATAISTYRGGSDVVASDVLGFDIRVYDPDTPNFVWLGSAPQNKPGVPELVPGPPLEGDDDGDLIVDEWDEVGWPNSDDALVSVNMPAINPIVGTAPFVLTSTLWPPPSFLNTPFPNSTPEEYVVAPPGEFVDFGYVRMGGGMVGGSEVIERLSTAPRNTFGAFFSTPFSGLTGSGTLPFLGRYPGSWGDAGRFVIPGPGFAVATGAGSVNSFAQPVIDTWTQTYDGDGFNQAQFVGAGGNFNVLGSAMSGAGNGVSTRYWINNAESSSTSGPSFINGSSASTQSTPPTTIMPRAIKISIRVYDRVAGEIRQQSVVHEFPR